MTPKSYRNELPRIYELKDLAEGLGDPEAYFLTVEDNLADPFFQENDGNRGAMREYRRLERNLASLPHNVWTHFKERVRPLLTVKRPGRGWQPLFDLLSEARGFRHLVEMGCSDVRFIPRASARTPDLQGVLDRPVLCEVKTINWSDHQAGRNILMAAGHFVAVDAEIDLAKGFMQKLVSTIDEAVAQLEDYDPQQTARWVVLTVLKFDDTLSGYQEAYLRQIDAHLSANPVASEFVFCVGTNPFERIFTMRMGTVVDL